MKTKMTFGADYGKLDVIWGDGSRLIAEYKGPNACPAMFADIIKKITLDPYDAFGLKGSYYVAVPVTKIAKKFDETSLDDVLQTGHINVTILHPQPSNGWALSPQKNSPEGGVGGASALAALDEFFNIDKHINVKCPDCGKARNTVAYIVMHLNDNHEWSRSRIADWLEEQNLNLKMKSPQGAGGK